MRFSSNFDDVDAENNGRIFSIIGIGVNITGLKIQNTNSVSYGGAVYFAGGSVEGCSFINTISSRGGQVVVIMVMVLINFLKV